MKDSIVEPTPHVARDSDAPAVDHLLGELRSENEWSELVLGNLQEGVLAVDDSSHVLLANHALHRLLGIADEPYLGRALRELVSIPMVLKLAARVLRDKTPCESLIELTAPARSLRILGRPLPLNALSIKVVLPVEASVAGNQRFGALLTIRDETMLRRVEAIRRDFVANASHELKTPLSAIRAYAETLQLGALDDRALSEQFVSNIIEQADRLNGLVQSMLQLSRVESGTALEVEWFDVREAAELYIAASTAVAASKNIRIDAQLPMQPLRIFCDRDAFQTIASNLLSNAIRYTREGGLVSVWLGQLDNDCVLRVTDTGIGIHPEDLDRIFERFFRAEKDRSSETGGTGLGLSIVKHLAQALGGVVRASSRPGVGSSFEVCLPIKAAVA